MPKHNVTAVRKTAKTSSYFVRSRGKTSKSGNGGLSQTWTQVKKRSGGAEKKNDIKDRAIEDELALAIGDAGSSCQEVVVSVLAQTDTETETETIGLNLRAQPELQGKITLDHQIQENAETATTAIDAHRVLTTQLLIQTAEIVETDKMSLQPLQKCQEGNEQRTTTTRSCSLRKPAAKLSPYFPKPLPLIETSCLPFPSISAPSFGLIQEQLSLSPFRLLIATIFLNRTRGPVAIPVLFKLFDLYPTIEDMACANHEDIVSIIRGLGFQNQRATKFIALARTWLESPPERGKRYRKLNYPKKRDGADVKPDEVVRDEADRRKEDGACDTRVAWEIAHLPGVGAYAIDSWRIFCRDRLRFGSSTSRRGTCGETGNEPEWKRVMPQDKELRAYLSWKWLQEGWVWNCENGSRTKADAEMMKRAEKGGVAFEGGDGHLIVMTDIQSSLSGVHDLQDVRKVGFSLECS